MPRSYPLLLRLRWIKLLDSWFYTDSTKGNVHSTGGEHHVLYSCLLLPSRRHRRFVFVTTNLLVQNSWNVLISAGLMAWLYHEIRTNQNVKVHRTQHFLMETTYSILWLYCTEASREQDRIWLLTYFALLFIITFHFFFTGQTQISYYYSRYEYDNHLYQNNGHLSYTFKTSIYYSIYFTHFTLRFNKCEISLRYIETCLHLTFKTYL